MFHYGVDMAYTGTLAEYLIETHRPEMLLLVMPIVSASVYDMGLEDISFRSPFDLFWRVPFVFANPQYALNKCSNWFERGYLQQPFDVFIAETGTYNKMRRDAEARGSLDRFLEAHPSFAYHSFWPIALPYIDESMRAAERVLEVAARFGTEVIITTAPMLTGELSAYHPAEVLEFYERLAEVSDGFWDFSFSSIGNDPRFFDDPTHFSNNVGYMLLARMFDDDRRFRPDDLGIWVTPDNAAEVAAKFSTFSQEEISFTRTIPILLYHDIVEEEEGMPSPALFRAHMSALYHAGFEAVPLTALKDYVLYGIELPERPVLITFDDGYLSNYRYAFPVLKEYEFHATIFPMGISFGRDTHWYNGHPIRPRFGAEEARRMVESGFISIQSHSYHMHHTEGFDPYPIRRGILRMEGESESDYIAAMRRDHEQFSALLYAATGEELFALAFPYGFHDEFAAVVLRELGITMTFASGWGHTTLVKGIPQSLLEMNRFSMYDDLSGDALVAMLLE